MGEIAIYIEIIFRRKPIHYFIPTVDISAYVCLTYIPAYAFTLDFYEVWIIISYKWMKLLSAEHYLLTVGFDPCDFDYVVYVNELINGYKRQKHLFSTFNNDGTKS